MRRHQVRKKRQKVDIRKEDKLSKAQQALLARAANEAWEKEIELRNVVGSNSSGHDYPKSIFLKGRE